MTKEQLLFSLLRSQINNEPIELSGKSINGDLLRQMLQLAQYHNIAHLAAYALLNNRLSSDDPLFSVCENYVLMEMANDARRTYALNNLQALFEKHGIAYMLLKGSVLRQLYSDTWMRNSCDIDILVHREEVETIASLLMNELEYTVLHRGLHDITLTHSKVNLELHFDLIEEGRAKQATSVLNDVWKYASHPDGSCAYSLPNEFFYFYHIAHMAKHMTNGGCGIRNFIDVWLLNRHISYDETKRRALLDQGGLSTFARSVEHLANVWFSAAEHTALSRDLERFVLSSGTYGSSANRIIMTKINFGGKKSYLLPRLFMPYRLMKLKYPILEKCPVLLPALWVLRIVKSVFSKKIRARTIAEVQAATQSDTAALDQTVHLMQQLEL